MGGDTLLAEFKLLSTLEFGWKISGRSAIILEDFGYDILSLLLLFLSGDEEVMFVLFRREGETEDLNFMLIASDESLLELEIFQLLSVRILCEA